MRGFLILLVLSLAATEKLDRTYLPPPNAKFAGGTPDELQVPLTSGTLLNENEQRGSAISRLDISQGPTEFGSRTPTNAPFIYYKESVPTTTISYAFSQTTTLPPFESIGTTANPIKSITGLPNAYLVPNYKKYGNQFVPGQERQSLESFNQYQHTDAPGLVKGQPHRQGQITNYVRPNYEQHDNHQLRQYQGQYQTANTPRGNIQVPTVLQETNPQKDYNNKNAIQEVYTQSTTIPQNRSIYSQELLNLRKESTSSPNLESYLRPGSSQSSSLNLYNQNNNLRPLKSNKNVYNENQYKQNNPFQQTGRNQDTKVVLSNSKDYQPESSLPFPEFNQVGDSSTTSVLQTSSTIIPTFGNYKHRERPQAETDRNALIVNYENVRSPNGYSYSYDTSNGIHADESGIVDDGTKAQGSYSYIGDDGKIYSLTYTADENGFQPRGDHIPTPPPIPEAILKVIEQVTREKEAGVYDDGYYHEEKYGDKKLQDKFDRVSPPNENRQYDSLSQNNQRKPITRIEFNNKNRMNPNIIDPEHIPLKSHEFNRIVFVDKNVVSTKPMLIFDSKKIFEQVPSPNELQINYPESEVRYAEPNKYFEPEIGLNNLRKQGVNNYNELSNTVPSSTTPPKVNKETYEGYQPPTDIRYKEQPEEIKNDLNKFNGKQTDVSRIVYNAAQSDFNKFIPNLPTSLVNDEYNQQRDENNGYTYNQPQTKFEHKTFPTRFRVQTTSTTMKPEIYKTYSKTTTLRPFMTPNVYNRDNDYRKPYSTVDATSSTTENYYSDVSDNGQESNKQDLDIPSYGFTRRFNDEVENTSRPYEIKNNTKLYQYMPNSQRNRVIQTGAPGYEFSVVPTTSLPSQFGSSRVTQDPITQYQKTPTFSAAVPSEKQTNSQIPSKSNFNSQTVGKLTDYNKTNLPLRPTLDSHPSTERSSFPNYSTTTYKPTSEYSASPKFAESDADSYETGYEYGPSIPQISYGSNIPSRPALISSGPGMYSQVDPGTIYQSSYPYSLFEFSQSTGPTNTKLNSLNNISQTSQLSQTPSYAQTEYPYRTTTSLPKVGTSISQTYSTSIYHPHFDKNGQYTQKPELIVNDNGRPINSANKFNSDYSPGNVLQSTYYTKDNTEDIPHSNQDMKYKNISVKDSTEQYAFSGYEKTGKVIGEDFSGPKQPQTFNSHTGYYY